MNHDEAVQEMATERYLLDELSPELKEAFEGFERALASGTASFPPRTA